MSKLQAALNFIVKDRDALHKMCEPVTEQTPPELVRTVINDLRRVSSILHRDKKLRCLGLAANQLGHNLRIFVLRDVRGKYEPFINPTIINSGRAIPYVETCYSCPGFPRTKMRYNSLTVQTETVKGGIITRTLTGLRAIAFQHELDHLNGVLIIDKEEK